MTQDEYLKLAEAHGRREILATFMAHALLSRGGAGPKPPPREVADHACRYADELIERLGPPPDVPAEGNGTAWFSDEELKALDGYPNN